MHGGSLWGVCPFLLQSEILEFKWGRESIKNDPHTGRPVEATSEGICQKLKSFVLADRRMNVSS